MNSKLNCRFAAIGAVLLLAWSASAQNLVISTISLGLAPANPNQILGEGVEAGIELDSSGNLYFADPSNNVIDRVSPAGVLQVFAGQSGVSGSMDGLGGSALFNLPTGVAVDAMGNVYVADTNNSTIRKITPAGIVSTFAGTSGTLGHQDGPGGSALFSLPSALTIDGAGNLYVADGVNPNINLPNSWGMTIRKITPTGAVSTVSYLHAIAALFPAPFNLQGIAIDGHGNIFVSVGSQDLYVASIDFHPPNGDTIFEISSAGVTSLYAGQTLVNGSTDGTGAQALFSNPGGLASDSSGNLYVADTSNRTIRMISPNGVVTTIAGAAGNPANPIDGAGGQAQFTSPRAIAVDSSGNVFITDGRAIRRGIPIANTQGPVRFVNLSARGTVGPSSPLIGGFVIEGTVSQTVLARAVGPTLAQFGVSNALGNAQLDIYNQAGVLVGSSSSGINATDSASAAALAGAFPLAGNSGDAPLVITLSPGLYTAVVSSPNGATGTALVEVYEVP